MATIVSRRVVRKDHSRSARQLMSHRKREASFLEGAAIGAPIALLLWALLWFAFGFAL